MAIDNVGNHDFEIAGPIVWDADGWGLDRATESWQGSAENEAAYINAIRKWSAHDTYDRMFLSHWTSDNHKQYPTVRLVYLGLKQAGLPPVQHESDTQEQTASSKLSSTGLFFTLPATIQFAAPSNVISYISEDGPGGLEPDTPSGAPAVRTWTVGDITVTITSLFADLISKFFTTQITTTPHSKEVVPGKFWQNTSRKTVAYVPWIFTFPSGPLVTLGGAGTGGFRVGQTFAISAGGQGAVISVTAIYPTTGSITGFTVTSSNFTTAHNLIPGPNGTLWNVSIIP